MSLLDLAAGKLFTARVLARCGVLAPESPVVVARVARTMRAWGPTPAGGYTVSALRRPDAPAVHDDRGTLTFAEVHRRTNALARSLAAEGLGPGDGVAIMCRNHRGFVEAVVACSKLGVDALYLNTAFAGPQIAEVVRAEGPAAIIADAEFSGLVAEASAGRRRFVAWHSEDTAADAPLLDDLIAAGEDWDLRPPASRGRVVILTSGTTGAPKGAGRHQPHSLDPAAALLDVIPLRAGEPTMIAAPLFHSWGLAHFTLGMALGSTLVLRRHFDPEGMLEAIARHRATALIVVPVMLQRILELPDDALERHDCSSLRVVAVSGSALPGRLAIDVMDRFGDVLYNLYGSTEVAWASVAGPADLRVAPGTAGRPPRGTVVRLLDAEGREVAPGETGRIFVTNEMVFEGYTGGGGKPVVDGLLGSGDVGHLDDEGRLFVDGRDDEMIVSGGENVFPREVEDLLAHHPGVEECAVVGADDGAFGQRLVAYVVVRAGAEPPTAEALKAYVRDNLARFKVPRDVHFVDALPRNGTGKVVKRELARDAGREGEHGI
ncbi:MAG TPA: AMP-binding protein [Solirubrobacteraceae bacterium]|nr:AMP-binding protein [Solirubrobacteraceae bacterium]